MTTQFPAPRFFRSAVLCAAALGAGWPLRAEVIDVDAAQLARMAADGVTVVDIRGAEEWRATGVVQGSRQLTYVIDAQGRGDPHWVDKVKTIVRPNQPVVLICRSGVRSAAAARQLDEAGYKKVYHVLGGITAWIGAGRPVVPPDGGQSAAP